MILPRIAQYNRRSCRSIGLDLSNHPSEWFSARPSVELMVAFTRIALVDRICNDQLLTSTPLTSKPRVGSVDFPGSSFTLLVRSIDPRRYIATRISFVPRDREAQLIVAQFRDAPAAVPNWVHRRSRKLASRSEYPTMHRSSPEVSQ